MAAFGEAPEDASHFVVLGKRITHAMPAEQAEDYPDEMKQDSDMVKMFGAGQKVTIVYRAGDELPEDMAREIYPSFGDRIAALDGNGMRKDSPVPGEPNGAASEAIQKWRDGDGHKPPG